MMKSDNATAPARDVPGAAPADLAVRLDALLAPLPPKFGPWMTALDAIAKAEPALAEAGYARVFARFPTMVQPRLRYARAAAQRGDWPEAVRRWEEVCDRFPQSLMAVLGLIAAVTELGPPARLEALLRAQLARPSPPEGLAEEHRRSLRVELGRLLIRAGKVAEARALWAELLREAPEDPEICRGHGEACQMAFYAQAEEAAPALVDTPPHAALFSRFEGLGANCEFGFAQRHFGAEPIGLLRWVGITPPRLIAALATRFEGIGEPDFTRLEARTKPVNEIIMHDSRYGLRMHTFVPNTGQDLAQLREQIMRRMRFTRRKLLEDLEAGEKIFVYRRVRPGPFSQLATVQAEIKRYNPGNWLLAIDPTPAGETPQPVRLAAPDLLHGTIPDASPPRVGDPWSLAPALWLAALQAATRLHTSAPSRPAS